VSADSLLHYEQAYYKHKHSGSGQAFILQKIAYYLRNNATGEETFNEIKRIDPGLISDKLQQADFLWNATLVAYMNGQDGYARHYLDKYNGLTADTSVADDLMFVLAYKYNDSARVTARLRRLVARDSVFKGLDCFLSYALYEKKHRDLYMLSSAIVPGSGTIMNGAVFKGVLSLCIAAASVYGVVTLINYGLYANAALWGTGVGLKFYMGNIRLTEKTFEQSELKHKTKLANACEKRLIQVLQKYPLTLK
jgi:hypothetical protein